MFRGYVFVEFRRKELIDNIKIIVYYCEDFKVRDKKIGYSGQRDRKDNVQL